ncbi:hypothetical protein Y032_0021g309 [Ancylostoma ceylanicum]|uniref:Uncharacterized protein n=1 Tax=Ancylostoma ceylanicum TaxID=53326 RepID=A0A016TQ90_9BILA|nr:hypothetical protein Y032_0085g1871 [Ancylostoma ceylanicum]EYC20609.1 hypothetical protein Y032_0021g309 [Ancylostoma ceylanicum]
METSMAGVQESLDEFRSKFEENEDDTKNFKRAINLILGDDTIQPHLKSVIGYLLDRHDRLSALLNAANDFNRKLVAEISSFKGEIISLKNAIVSSNTSSSDKSVESRTSFEEIERNRSVVISGVTESKAKNSTVRAHDDYVTVKEILDHLSVECNPLSVYRMGKPMTKRPRLLKVVLPTSFFQRQMLRRAHWLKSFSVRGIFVRPSLSKAERDRMRQERALPRTNCSTSLTQSPRNTVRSDVTSVCASSKLSVARNSGQENL